MNQKAVILDGKALNRAIARVSYEIIERNKGTKGVCIIGVFTKGAILATRIKNKLTELEHFDVPIGFLDITAYRDDQKPSNGYVDKTDINFDIGGKKIILVDDVIYTGRTARAAIDALMSLGRPQNIQLAALIDRGHRELPIRPDYTGKNVPTSRDELVKVMLLEQDETDKVTLTNTCAEKEEAIL